MPDLYSGLSVSHQPLLWTQLAELLLKAQDAARWSIQDILDRQDDPYTQDGYYMYKFNAYKAAAKRYRSSAQVHTHCMILFSKASSNSQAAISSMINQTRLCSMTNIQTHLQRTLLREQQCPCHPQALVLHMQTKCKTMFACATQVQLTSLMLATTTAHSMES